MTKLSRGRAPKLAATRRPSTIARKSWANRYRRRRLPCRDLGKRNRHGPETRYASILPRGFVLQNATAIDNGGDIAGFGTDGTNNVQAFVIYAVPEPGTLTLLLAGLVGLLAYAWRKRK